ncbi:MAG: hypothetical protein L3K08_05415, partial [Thermoplasmata archaeon]|nr:hypothetical protein [Thermoplasmata archaeon]
MSNDPGDSGVVLFGGANATNGALLNDTWVFSGGAWAEAAAGGAAPDPRSAPALAWSASASSVVLLGGCDALHRDPCANDTWRFSHGAWVQQVIPGPPVGPGATGPHTYVELSLNSTGGLMAVPIPASNGSPAGGWYSYAGSSWKSLLAPGAPRSVNGTAVVEDSDLAKIVVFPGTPGRLASNSTTWIGAGSSWSNLTVNAPSAREGAAFAFDSADGYAVLFGGDPSGGPSLGPGTNDTWRYSAGTWSRILTNQSPPAFTSPGLVYDVRDGYVLLFGGISGPSAKYVNQTWEFTKGGWSRITPHNSPSGQALRDGSLVYDAADGYVLWVGGPAGTAYTWTYVAGNWTNATSSVRPTGPPANGLAYDFGDAYVLEQGTEIPGPFGATYTTQTWSFLNGAWTNHTVSIGPPPLTGGSLSYDPLIPGVVLFGGQVPGSSGVNSTWIYRGGNWTESAGPFDPPPLVGATSTFDTADQALVLFGGTDQIFGPASRSESCSPSACNATYTWSTATLAHPYVSGFVAGEPTLDLGHSTNLTTTVTGGTGWIRYAYQDLPTGCVSQNVSVLACSPTTTGSFQPSVTVLDSVGHSAGTTTMLSVTSPLVIAVFNASPSVVPLAQRTLLSVKVAGGSGTTSYAYLGLPPGCTTQSIPTLPCSPKGSGDFPIVVSVTDTGGGSAGTALDLKVLSTGPPGGPSIDGFALEPAALVLGNSTTIVVNASGGDPPLRYAYSGLPPGCASLNVSSLGCDPTTQGVYELTLTVQGANGSSASVMTNLTVYPAGGGGGLQITSFSGSPGVVPLGQS